MNASAGSKSGFTLLELGVVVLVLALVSSLAAQRFAQARRHASLSAAACDMAAIRDAFLGTPSAPGYLDDMGRVPGFTPGYLRIANLLVATNLYAFREERVDLAAASGKYRIAPAASFTNWSETGCRGWRGPYIRLDSARAFGTAYPARTARRGAADLSFEERGFYPRVARLSLPAAYRDGSVYGFGGEPSLLDPWGDPYVLQIPPAQAFATGSGNLDGVTDDLRFRYARIVSAGPDGVLSTPCFFGNTNAAGSAWSASQKRDSKFAGRAADRGDDLVLFLNRADCYEEGD